MCFKCCIVVEQVSGKDHLLNHLGIPAACFTHPEISMVGLTESDSKNSYAQREKVTESLRFTIRFDSIRDSFKADIGIAVADATHAARGASDIVLTEPGLSVIISVVLTSRAIFQRMKNYTIYAVSITIHIVFGFMLIALIWKFDFAPFMVLIIAILNDGSVQPSPMPDSWKLKEIFATGVVLRGYLALMTVDKFGVRPLGEKRPEQMMAALYLQVSIVSQALIFVTRSRSWSFAERPGLLLLFAFVAASWYEFPNNLLIFMCKDKYLYRNVLDIIIATLIAVYAKWGFATIEGCGWGWAGVIWLYSVVTYIPLDLLKFAIRYALSGKAWDTLLENKLEFKFSNKGEFFIFLWFSDDSLVLTAFTTKSNYGKEEREAQWATAQRTLHGLQLPETTNLFSDKSNYRELSEIAEQAKRRAEVASYTYSGEASEEFDRDDNTLTLIKPSPMPSKDIRSPLEVGSVHGGNNGVWNVDLEENKIE
ncbi:hypothetical protein HYC85_013845 [Camellia sinensis]|uniref:Cation-transporting P-type ATPase C-terminal domain-containing protein n=1 Tax=Camellia sinensis TaxID=4442 RepID=A0A7J7H811_CAMSI|nr:hypothetical protein HYC85_013845 [Camellia sinensis]